MTLPSRNQQRAITEKLIRAGMVAAIRDIQEFIGGRFVVETSELHAFLMTQLIVCGEASDEA